VREAPLVRARPSGTSGRRPAPVRRGAARHAEIASRLLGSMLPAKRTLAKRTLGGTSDMLIARAGEEIVCPKGTVCGRMTRDANDHIGDGDFAALECRFSADDQRYACACCGRAVAVREDFRWRVHLRRGWLR